MPAADFAAVARQLAAQLRASGQGFLTMRRDELRDAFQVGRISANLAEQIDEALASVGIMISPPPGERSHSLRLYEQAHLVGQVAHSVLDPDASTDAPLRKLAALERRARAGRDLRSDDVPWLEAFDLLLQVATGREPQGWEELRDDRHGSTLAAELAEALALSPKIVTAAWFLRLACAVCVGRPTKLVLTPDALVGNPEAVSNAEAFIALVERRERLLRETHVQSIHAAAQTVLGKSEVPVFQVELGVLNLRRRIEDL